MKISISQQVTSANAIDDVDAAAAAVVRLYDQLHGRALLLTQCRHDADDLVQRVVERALSHPHVFGPGHQPWGWLTRVMRNLFVDDCRMRGARKTTDIDPQLLAEPAVEYQPAPSDLPTEDDLQEAMAKLPEKQQSLVRLAHFSGYSYRQLAAEFGVTCNTVGTRLLRSRRRLKRLLREARDRKLPHLGA